MNVVTLDGRILPIADIEVRNGWDFYRVSTGERLTYKIKLADKRSFFPNFEWEKSNDEIYRERRRNQGVNVGAPLSESDTANFLEHITTDPLSAPAEWAENVTNTVTAAAKSPVTWAMVAVVVIVLVVIYVPRRP